ncbi:antifreeze protein [Mycena rebaudengoi]|nr:antifreeze protein [Mycena rebaudengoi]
MLSFTTSTVLITLLSIVNGAPSARALGPAGVNLRTAGNYAILSKAGVSTVSPSSINADVGVSPIAATGLTGFSLTLDSSGTFSTSTQVVGKLFAASYGTPTPATLTVAIGDMETAFDDANGRINPDFSDLASGALGGLTLTPGLYKWAGAVSAASDFTISGTSTDTWIFQVAGTLNIAAGKKAILAGGALKANIVWVVSGAITVADGGHLEGVILGKTSVSLLIGASLNGRILAQTSAALQTATVVS